MKKLIACVMLGVTLCAPVGCSMKNLGDSVGKVVSIVDQGIDRVQDILKIVDVIYDPLLALKGLPAWVTMATLTLRSLDSVVTWGKTELAKAQADRAYVIPTNQITNVIQVVNDAEITLKGARATIAAEQRCK